MLHCIYEYRKTRHQTQMLSHLSRQKRFRAKRWFNMMNGVVNLRFAKIGDRIAWGDHKYARPMTDTTNRALIQTSSGDEYLVGNGVIMNLGAKKYARLWGKDRNDNPPAELGDVTIGEPWTIENFARTTPVVSVELQYKIGAPELEQESTGIRRVKAKDPIEALESYVEVASELAYPEEKA
jgi:hypothetical protein